MKNENEGVNVFTLLCLLLHIHPYMADSFIYPEERPKHRRRCINTHTPVQKGVFFCKEELCCNGGLSFSALSK